MTGTKHKRTVSESYNGEDALDKAATALIEREVLHCQSALVDTILAAGRSANSLGADPCLPEWEDVENLYEHRCPECGEGVIAGADSYACHCGWTTDDGGEPDTEPQEVFEWWLVTDYLADKLSERGHVTLSDGQSTWWGRCCTGQAILLDGIMQRIVCETGYCGWPQGKLEQDEVS